jgi:hypothetical protein
MHLSVSVCFMHRSIILRGVFDDEFVFSVPFMVFTGIA